MKKIVINIILLLIVLLFCELIYYSKFKTEEPDNLGHKFILFPQSLNINDYIDNWNKEKTRNNEGLKYQKDNNGIILAGCSFAYSWGLKDEDTLAKRLSDKTKRPVYVRAIPSFGPNENLFFLTQKEFFEVTPQSEYYIYVFIKNHFSRIFSKIYGLNNSKLRPFFEIDKNFQAKQKFCWYKPLFLSNIFKFYYRRIVTLNYGNVNENELFKIMASSNKILKEKYPDIKFVFVNYSEEDYYKFSEGFKNNLKEQNIIYVDMDEIVLGKGKVMSDKKYFQEDGHPSAYAYKLAGEKLGELINKKEI